jgi:hypothetical protein
MADKDVLPETGAENLDFAPLEEVPIHFCDACLVAGGEDIFTLNFYHTELPSVRGAVKDQRSEPQRATCFARVALTPIGFTRLLKTMAERAGFVLTRLEE